MPFRDKMKSIADAGFMKNQIQEQLAKLEKVLPNDDKAP